MISVKLLRYPTAKAVFTRMWEPAAKDLGITVEEMFDQGELGGVTPSGAEVTMTLADAVESAEREGFWGFAEEAHTIHFWARRDELSLSQLTSFFAHELTHILYDALIDTIRTGGHPRYKSIREDADIESVNEEFVADFISVVAGAAVEIAGHVMSSNEPEWEYEL